MWHVHSLIHVHIYVIKYLRRKYLKNMSILRRNWVCSTIPMFRRELQGMWSIPYFVLFVDFAALRIKPGHPSR